MSVLKAASDNIGAITISQLQKMIELGYTPDKEMLDAAVVCKNKAFIEELLAYVTPDKQTLLAAIAQTSGARHLDVIKLIAGYVPADDDCLAAAFTRGVESVTDLVLDEMAKVKRAKSALNGGISKMSGKELHELLERGDIDVYLKNIIREELYMRSF